MTAARRPPNYVAQLHIDSPLGAMLAARTAEGLAGLWFTDQADCPEQIDAPECPSDEVLHACLVYLTDYWAGRQPAWTRPIDLHGTDFQQAVWRSLLAIGQGEWRSYGVLAKDLNRPQAQRAIGAAVGANPISILIPCHRVLGATQTLTGYSGGIQRKIALLTHEGFTIQGNRVIQSTQPRLFAD